jgi:hypothetical protein
MLPGEPHTAEQGDRLQQVVDRDRQRGQRRRRRGDALLLRVLFLRTRRVPRRRDRELGAQQQHGGFVLYRLEPANRLTELFACPDVVDRGLQTPARDPGCFGGQHRVHGKIDPFDGHRRQHIIDGQPVIAQRERPD